MNKNAKVEMYYKDGCPFCIRAKALLVQKGWVIREYPAKRDQTLFAEMVDRSGGRRTFPQIFINDRHIGGCDELYSLEDQGKLDGLSESEGSV
ncbi:glutaredoxin 3 [Candidatus Haliotispira prima]|uniref:Glutaredoxin n=1 Tax=Candidatus Haliotispira prima TaxID=3034016 RepID=A0ABY8MFL2_9SPIO|nr:glutaredoxin 3 [Candidatus Haliotispira prima]